MDARIYVEESTFLASEEEVREMCTHTRGLVGVHYAFSYGRSVKQVLELKEAVRKDFPDMKDCDMTVWILDMDETIRHASVMTLYIEIPVDDYLRLRQEKRIDIK